MSNLKEQAEENEHGHLIHTRYIGKGNGESVKIEVNVTKLFEAGKRTTTNVTDLVREAQMKDEGYSIENPYIPGTAEVAEAAIDKIHSEGLEPAWTQ